MHLDHIHRSRVSKPKVKARIMRGRVAPPRDNISALPPPPRGEINRCANRVPWALWATYEFKFQPMMSVG